MLKNELLNRIEEIGDYSQDLKLEIENSISQIW